MNMQTAIRFAPPASQAAFEKFHEENPHVYIELVNLTRTVKGRGVDRYGMDTLFGVLRFRHTMQTNDPLSTYKLNNNHKPYYARMIMKNNPDLDGMFETRERDE